VQQRLLHSHDGNGVQAMMATQITCYSRKRLPVGLILSWPVSWVRGTTHFMLALLCLQRLDTVGCASGRASGL